MIEENIGQKPNFKNVDETRNYLVEEIDHNELMRKKTKRFVWHFVYLVSVVMGCISIFAFAFLGGIPIRFMRSAVKFKICPIIAAIKQQII